MSWLISRALMEQTCESLPSSQEAEVGCSVAKSSGGEPSAPSSGNPSPQALCASDKMTDFSRLSRYGMTFGLLTEDHGEAVLTSFLAAFPARILAPLERAKESTVRVPACGEKWRESSARFDLDSSSWKTHRCLWEEDLSESSVILPQWGMMLDGVLWERITAEDLTNATGSGLWRSPAAQEPGVSIERLRTETGDPVGSMCRHYDKETGRMAQIGLTQQVQARETKIGPLPGGSFIPTPTATDATAGAIISERDTYWMTKSGMPRKINGNGTDGSVGLGRLVQMWPTPTSSQATRGDCPSERDRRTPMLETQVRLAGKDWPTPTVHGNHNRKGMSSKSGDGLSTAVKREQDGGTTTQPKETPDRRGKLNPDWVAWLMGWPIGWASLKPMETDRYRLWRQLHGLPSIENLTEQK